MNAEEKEDMEACLAESENEIYDIHCTDAPPERSYAEQEKEIAECHKADVDNGLTEADANDSDAFDRRVLGLPPGTEEKENDEGPVFRRGKCTRCGRTKDYCEC